MKRAAHSGDRRGQRSSKALAYTVVPSGQMVSSDSSSQNISSQTFSDGTGLQLQLPAASSGDGALVPASQVAVGAVAPPHPLGVSVPAPPTYVQQNVQNEYSQNMYMPVDVSVLQQQLNVAMTSADPAIVAEAWAAIEQARRGQMEAQHALATTTAEASRIIAGQQQQLADAKREAAEFLQLAQNRVLETEARAKQANEDAQRIAQQAQLESQKARDDVLAAQQAAQRAIDEAQQRVEAERSARMRSQSATRHMEKMLAGLERQRDSSPQYDPANIPQPHS